LWFPGNLVVFGIEDREMLPDDLRGGIALEPFGALVPGRDVPRRVEREDGVVGDAFDQELIKIGIAAPRLGRGGHSSCNCIPRASFSDGLMAEPRRFKRARACVPMRFV